ncbi:30S ribosomal protein S2 [Candidatus Uhrbacteria bacterium]|nr:30S ribosomal protein S2 [Candidatus Uhrbacteria bacterium]
MDGLPTVVELLQSGVHFGHKTSKRHPKMESAIYSVRNGIHIIDLEKSLASLEKACVFLKDLGKRGGTVLFVGTKSQAKDAVQSAAQSCGMPWVTTRWVGGSLTNFSVISKMIKAYKKQKEQRDSGELAKKYTKKEQLEIARHINDQQKILGGIENLSKQPDAVYIVDVKKDRTAFREALSQGVPIIAISDTNVNPDEITYPIFGNDDAVKAISLITHTLSKALMAGQSEAKAASSQVAVPEEPIKK